LTNSRSKSSRVVLHRLEDIPIIGHEFTYAKMSTAPLQEGTYTRGLAGNDGIVNLSRIGLTDPQHTGFTTGRKPIILGVGQASFR